MPYERTFCVNRYNGILREVVLRLKRRSGQQLAELMGRFWGQQHREAVDGCLDGVIPVPLHWWRRWSRGYNQSEAVANGIAKELGLPVLHCLKRIRHTPSQAQQRHSERLLNVKGAFESTQKHLIKGKRLLLVDDVVTTGATIGEAARMVKKAGSATITVAALARAERD